MLNKSTIRTRAIIASDRHAIRRYNEDRATEKAAKKAAKIAAQTAARRERMEKAVIGTLVAAIVMAVIGWTFIAAVTGTVAIASYIRINR